MAVKKKKTKAQKDQVKKQVAVSPSRAWAVAQSHRKRGTAVKFRAGGATAGLSVRNTWSFRDSSGQTHYSPDWYGFEEWLDDIKSARERIVVVSNK